MRKTLALIPVLALALSGCEKNGVKEFTPSQSEKDSALKVVQNTAALQQLKSNPKSGDAITAFSSINSDAQMLIAGQQQRNSSKGSGIPGLLTAALDKADSFDTCVTQSGGTITYAGCTSGTNSIDGTIAVSGDQLTVDLTIKASGSGVSGDLTYKGAVTITDSSMDGHLSFTYEVSGVTYEVSVSYEALVAGADGCLTGGSLNIDADYKIAGVGISTGSTSATVRFDFGPACGDIAAFGG